MLRYHSLLRTNISRTCNLNLDNVCLSLDDFLRGSRVTLLALWAHLAEHCHGVKPHIDALDLQLVVDLGDGDTLNIDVTTVCLEDDLVTLAVFETTISKKRIWKRAGEVLGKPITYSLNPL